MIEQALVSDLTSWDFSRQEYWSGVPLEPLNSLIFRN